MPNVVKIQSGYKVQPLSAYLKQPAAPTAPGINFPKINKELVKTNFFEYLGFALQFAPPGPEEKEIRAKLASIGKDLSPEQKAAVAEGMKQGEAKVEDGVKHLGTKINGWNIASITGDRAFFNGDWLKRAEAAKAGIYGNDAVEAMYPLTTTLANGEPLDGSKNKYTLTFAAGEFPPVNAFWSVTMYDGKTQLLIKNPINRYLINSPMLPNMKKNADGSLTLYIQKDSPGKDKESNWLPAPNDLIYLVLRLYWPKGNAVDSATRRRHLETAGRRGGSEIRHRMRESPLRVQEKQSTFHRHAQRNVFLRYDVPRNQDRSPFAVHNPQKPKPNKTMKITYKPAFAALPPTLRCFGATRRPAGQTCSPPRLLAWWLSRQPSRGPRTRWLRGTTARPNKPSWNSSRRLQRKAALSSCRPRSALPRLIRTARCGSSIRSIPR